MRKTLKIKPLSINDNCPIKKQAYFKEIERQLPRNVKIPKDRLYFEYEFYVSNDAFDRQNAEKPTTDAICKAWNLQDSNVYSGYSEKFLVPKGKERIVFYFRKHRSKKHMKTLLPLTLCIIITYSLGILSGIYANEIMEVVRSMAQSNFN